MIWLVPLVIVLLLGYFSSRYHWWAKTVPYSVPRVLMYHMVREHLPGGKFNGLRVPPHQFEQQLQWLRKDGWTFFTLAEMQQRSNDLPEKSVALTFDDGYEDNLTNVLPLLEKYDAKATIYIVCDRHDRDWSVYKKKHHSSGELMREPKLSDTQIERLVASGRVEIASHTLTHLNLRDADDATAKEEILASKQQLEKRFVIKVKSFAYPFGIFTERDVALVQTAGYDNAVTTEQGCSNLSDPFRLARVKISGKEGMFAFRLRMRLGRRN